ncbi:helix-turn-helix domain-containing protein [Spelaeicoccus albus]|uniref:Transcriptional regulator with XRE-family HTH domain n=1 Tax=Spelaeicoccus albus TaxID=1280376 RepID=A0A7Z0A9M5_9MICO|nr:helix-turn-helix transcriptional regulator [Spelaeicoccus albus]NYI66105.1 transcriptional regulator with XRE-family HTH domain [Spelaeicoccus albus]
MTERSLRSILGSNARALRRSRGLTQEGLAEVLGVTPRYYAGLERGERNLTLDSIDDLAKQLQVPAGSLLAEAEQ